MATMADVAEHLDVSVETIRLLKKRGVLSAAARGQMNLDESRVSYLRHLREQAAGRSSDAAQEEGLDLVKERARLANLNADYAEMRNAKERGELAPIAAVSSAVVNLIELSKAQLMKLPARIAGSDARLKVRLQTAIEEALEELTLARVEESTGGQTSDGEEEE